MSTPHQDYRRAIYRLKQSDQAYKDAESTYIDHLLLSQSLKIGDLVQSKDGKITVRIDRVFVSVDENRIFSVKGPALKKDGSLSEKQIRSVLAEDGLLIPYRAKA